VNKKNKNYLWNYEKLFIIDTKESIIHFIKTVIMKSYHLKKAIVMSILLVFAFTSITILQSSKLTATIEISGKVIDGDSGQPLAGVKVTAVGESVTTTTNAKGIYTIKVSESVKSLRFEHPNFATEEKLIGGKNKIDATLWAQVLVEESEADDALINSTTNSIGVKKMKEQKNRTASYSPVMSGNVATYDQPIIEHNTEEYDVINENKFKDAKSNPLSTFSVDVDRASYSNTRRFLTNNQMPQKDVVRIEELINYFEYDYPQPTGNDPFSTNLEMGTCPWNSKHYLVNIGIQGKNIPLEKLPASNLVFLLDVSGSMSAENKLPLLQKAFKILVENLRKEDKVAMVVYAGAAGVVLPATSDKEKMIAALDLLNAGGSTAGGEGIQLAYKIAKENFIEGGNNRVILATDGDFNVGQSSDAALVRMIEDKRNDNIFLTILGFGMGNYKDAKMEQLSNAGNGNYAYIDNVLEAKKTLGKEIWGTLYTIAKDVKIQIEFNPAKIKAYRLIGYENRMLASEDFNDDKKDAGDIGAGHTVTAIYEIIPAGSDENVSNVDDLEYQDTKINKSDNLLTLKLRYKEPEGTESKLIVSKIKGDNIKTKGFSDNFNFSASVAQFGMLLRDSEFKGTATYKNTMELAKSSKGKDNEGYRAEFIKLIEIAELLSK